MVTTANQTKFPYFKFFIENWLEGTRNLTYEERGAYIDFIALTMKNEGALADDDDWFAHQMHVSKRLWKSVKTKLSTKGKLILSDGNIVNNRCLTELNALLAERKKRSSAATTREAEKRGERTVQSPFADDSAASQPRVSAEPDANKTRLGAEIFEKSNKINDDQRTAVVPSYHYIDIDIDIDKKRESLCPAKALDAEELEAGKLYVNGTKISNPGKWSLGYDSIDLAADRLGRDRDQVREDAKVIAQGWVDNDMKIKDPFLKLISDLKVMKTGSVKVRNYQTIGFEKPSESGASKPFFWDLYPLKVAKGAAFDAWAKLSRDQRRKAYEALVRQRDNLALQAKQTSKDGRCCCPHAATWLNDGRWDDQPEETGRSPQPERTPAEREKRERLAEMFGIEGASP